MAITTRNLPVGTRLVADYKKQRFVCTVEKAEEGEGVVYALEDGKKFKSPSAAGSAVMGGTACNGWRFWTVEGEEPPEGDERSEKGRFKDQEDPKGEFEADLRRARGHGSLLVQRLHGRFRGRGRQAAGAVPSGPPPRRPGAHGTGWRPCGGGWVGATGARGRSPSGLCLVGADLRA